MGIVNTTPDSFSDGGINAQSDVAITTGLAMAKAGAAIIDVGGESTRPGAEPVPVDEEIRRTERVVRELSEAGIIVSIDTSKPEVASRAIDAGAAIINDVTGFRNRDMLTLAADTSAGIVAMHMHGSPRTMQANPSYDDVVQEVTDFLEQQAAAALEAGIDRRSIAIDPGIGFGKTTEHNLHLLAGIPKLTQTGFPVVIGVSRKRFLGSLIEPVSGPTEPQQRDVATMGAVAFAITLGAQVHRVHNVPSGVEVAQVVSAMVRTDQG